MREVNDVNARAVALGALALLGAIALALLIAAWAWHAWLPDGSATGPNGKIDFSIPSPQLASAPQADRAAYFKEKEALISSYDWLDRKQGIARIPVEEAMRILARQQATAVNKEGR